VGQGNKYNTRCVYGEAPFFQGTGLVNTVTLRAPTHSLITILPSTKKDEAYRQLRLMKRCITGWLFTGEDLLSATPSIEMRPSVWEHFAHDLVWYVSQTKQLALQNRGVCWTPDTLGNDVSARGSAYLREGVMLRMDFWYISDCLIMRCSFTIWIGIAGYHSGTPCVCCPVILASSDGGLMMHWMGLCTDTQNLVACTYDTYWHRWHYVRYCWHWWH
jgi:hypothetical protein